MSEIITVGLDLAKNVFQVHGADVEGRAVLRKKLRRGQMLEFFNQLPVRVVAMEACGGAHFWGREIGKLGHEVLLIPPAYVKPFVKRQKNDAADSEATCEAAMRPTMGFVAVKSEETHGAAMVFRVRELLIRQRTQAINALRGHLAEFGRVMPQGAANASKLIAVVEDPDSGLPAAATATLHVLIGTLAHLEAQVAELDGEISRCANENEVAQRLMTVPGVPPRKGMLTFSFRWRRHRVLKSGTVQSIPTSRRRLCTKPVVYLSGMPNSTFMVRQVWIAASLKLGRRPRFPVGGGFHTMSGSNQIVSDPRRVNASLCSSHVEIGCLQAECRLDTQSEVIGG